MELQDIRTNLRDRLGVPDEDGLFTDTVLTRIINRAVQKVAGEWDWVWLEKLEAIATADGVSQNDVAANWESTVSLHTAPHPHLRMLTVEDMDYFGGEVQGRPKAFTDYGKVIQWYPVPDGVYTFTHRYVAFETELSGDTDEPLAPEPWIDAIIEWAAHLCYRKTGNVQMAGAAQAAYTSMVDKMKTRANARARTTGGGQDAPAPTPQGQQ